MDALRQDRFALFWTVYETVIITLYTSCKLFICLLWSPFANKLANKLICRLLIEPYLREFWKLLHICLDVCQTSESQSYTMRSINMLFCSDKIQVNLTEELKMCKGPVIIFRLKKKEYFLRSYFVKNRKQLKKIQE